MPHMTNVKNKFKGVGEQIKYTANTESNIIIQIEIFERSEQELIKSFIVIFSNSISQVIHLADNYFRIDRLVVADSTFSSIKTSLVFKKKVFILLGQ